MDDDENVLAVDCSLRSPSAAQPNATLALRLTVSDAAAALAEYSPGAVVHGSQMWGCSNETILGTVDSAAMIDAHSISLLLSRAGYEQIFDRAEILFQQPTVNAVEADADAETQSQSQPQSGESSSAPAPAAAGSGPMRRILALPPSTGSLPFDFPESVTAEPEATRSGAVPTAPKPKRSFRSLDNANLQTDLILPSGLLTPSSTITLRVRSSRSVKNDRWRVTLRRWEPTDILDHSGDYGGVDLHANGFAVGQWISFGIDLNWWANKNIERSLLGYFFLVEYWYDESGSSRNEQTITAQFWLPATNFIFPAGLMTPSSTVTLQVWAANDVKNSQWRVWLKRYNPIPLQSNKDFGFVDLTQSCTRDQWCSLNIRLSGWTGVEPSMLGYYFAVKYSYSCSGWVSWGTGVCDEYVDTEQFWLPITSSGSLLGDGNGKPAVSAFSRSCSDLSCSSSSQSTLDGVMCKVCSPARSVSVKLLCDGCKVDYSATISKLAMDYGIVYLKTELVADARVEVKMTATASVELSVKATPQFNIIKDVNIPVPGYGITIAGVTLGLVASFSLDGQAELDFQGSATVNARTALVAEMQGSVKYDIDASPRTTNRGSTPTVTHSESPTVSISAAAQVGMEIMLRPSVKVGISHVAYAKLSADAFVRVDGSFRYPPFPALSTPYQLPSPVPASLIKFGSCTTPHLLRYGVTAGVRNVSLTPVIDIDIGSPIDKKALGFADYKHEFDALLLMRLLQAQIVSGCLLPMSAAEPGLDQTLQLRSPVAMADIERSALAFDLAMDISSALGIDASRVRVQLLDGNKQPLRRVVHHTMALPHGDETRGREMHSLASSTVTAATVTVVSPATGASGVSAAAATQSLREQLALPSSTLSNAIAASRFVPPVTYAWSEMVWGACSCVSRVQTGTTACTGSDASTPSTSDVCGVQPATSRSCTPTGCGTSGGGGGGSGGSTGGGGTADNKFSSSSTGAGSGGAGGVGGGGNGGGGGLGGAGGSDPDSDSSSGVPLLWIGVGAGGGVALIALTIALIYFCYVKPRRNLIKPLGLTVTAPQPPPPASGLPSAAAPYVVTGPPGSHWATTRGPVVHGQGMPSGVGWQTGPNAYGSPDAAVHANHVDGAAPVQPVTLYAQQQQSQPQHWQQQNPGGQPSRAAHAVAHTSGEPMFVEQL